MAELIDLKNGNSVEVTTLCQTLERMFVEDVAEQQRLLKILSNQFREWDESESALPILVDKDFVYLSNKLWDKTAISSEFSGHKQLLKWLKGINDTISIVQKHISSEFGTQSCCQIPLILSVNNQTIREWFSQKTAQLVD